MYRQSNLNLVFITLTTLKTGLSILFKTYLFLSSINVLEHVEAMDMSDEEVEELLEQAPWRVRRWIKGIQQQGQECSTPKPLAVTITAEEGLKNVLGVASNTHGELMVSTVYADVRPSTSGLTDKYIEAGEWAYGTRQ